MYQCWPYDSLFTVTGCSALIANMLELQRTHFIHSALICKLACLYPPNLALQNKEEEQEAARFEAVFPCILEIMPTCIFNKKDPIVLGIEVREGIAKVRINCIFWHAVTNPT